MKTYFLAIPLLFLFVCPGFGQAPPELSLLEKSYDFGVIEEAGGPVEHTFYFVNNGEDSLRINSVKASCGCTTPAWSTDPVAPADTGFITARYNPNNRPGKFNKSLTITSNASRPLQVLTIAGKVSPRPRTPAEDFPTKNGALRSRYRAFYLGTVTTKGPVSKEFDLYNESQDTLFIQPNTIAPEHIQLAFMPDTLLPESHSKIIITYDPVKKGSFGYHADNIVFFTSEEENPHKSYSVMATIQEYFPPMTEEELRQAPRVSVDDKLINFGNMVEGDTAIETFTLRNNGLTPLEIREIRTNCGCAIGKMELKRLLPGESAKATVSFYSRGRKGNQQKMLSVFTNDPQHPVTVVTLKAGVEERKVPDEPSRE
ncbi:MAG: DUF1573 domain-containing protein [Cyclobacteriaceae bacterium]